MKGRILITPRGLSRDGHPALRRFEDAGYEVVAPTPGRQPTEAELLDVLPGCAGILAGVETISAKVLEAAAAKGLKVIGRNGVGIDSIDLDAAGRLNVTICPTPGANSRGVAELVVSLMFALARAIPFSDANLKAGQWRRRKGTEIDGRTLGIIGCGQIGKHVTRMALGLGMKVLACDPVVDASFRPGEGFSYVDLDTVLSQADVLSLHCPAPPDGRPVIDATALAKVAPGALLINTARGVLVDEPAVLAALEAEQLAGFATDVYAEEPPGKSPLLVHPRVIATPHVGGYTVESVDRSIRMAVDLMLDCLQS